MGQLKQLAGYIFGGIMFCIAIYVCTWLCVCFAYLDMFNPFLSNDGRAGFAIAIFIGFVLGFFSWVDANG
jgi:hypothetical protein